MRNQKQSNISDTENKIPEQHTCNNDIKKLQKSVIFGTECILCTMEI